MPRRDEWTHDQLLIALRLYARLPFGRLHGKNPEIVALAGAIGRTPGALAMKACNFASLDPAQQARGVRALGNTSEADRALWAEFRRDAEAVAAAAEEASARLGLEPPPPAPPDFDPPDGPSDREQLVRVRRVQSFFRAAVLTSYENRCALTGLDLPELLTASHIVPWSQSVTRRADPTNGVCLNALLDRAFDGGLFTFDDALRVVVSARWQRIAPTAATRLDLASLHGRPVNRPSRFEPDPESVRFHREHVFKI
jgi:putative restriction endonuclease